MLVKKVQGLYLFYPLFRSWLTYSVDKTTALHQYSYINHSNVDSYV